MDMNKIGARIRDERKKHNFTIAEMSERANISSNFLGNIERGVDTPSVETLMNIANALFVGLDWLVQDSLEINYMERKQSDFEGMEIQKETQGMSKRQKQCVLSCIRALKDFQK